MTNVDSTTREAYAECRRLARHYENFPVASYLAPRDRRDALAAIYAFARYADDVADEPGISRQEARLAALAEWRRKLLECMAGEHANAALAHPSAAGYRSGTESGGASGGESKVSSKKDLVFIALGHAVREFRLSPEHFENLLRAFESDVRVNRHRNFASLLAYCTCSANPVGRLVLELFNHRDPELFALSDAICTALQLTNFWQDARVDFERDRIYLPLEDIEHSGYTLEDLAAGRADERWRRLMAFEVSRTRELFERGKPLTEKVEPKLRRQLRLTWLGGMAILAKIESAGYDVFRHRPELNRLDFLRLYLKARRPFAGAGAREQAAVSPGRVSAP